MRTTLILSTVLHVALFLIAVIGLPRPEDRLALTAEPIPVEIVELGLITNTRIDKPEDRPKPPPPQPSPPPAELPPPPPEAKLEPTPPPPEKVPEPPKPEPLPEPKPEPVPEPLPKKEEPKPEPPKPEPPKPEPPKKEPPKKEEPKKEPPKKEDKKPPPKEPPPDLTSVLKDLEKLKTPTPPSREPAKETVEKPQPSSLDPSRSDRLTISEEDALRRQIGSCWNVPVGARDAQNLKVSVRIRVNPDRTVQSAEVIDTSRMGDPFYRAAAESALRAVKNPRCNPLLLPEGQYDRWKVIVFNFDPRDML